MRRKKFEKSIDGNAITRLNCYAVDSIITQLFYLVDNENFAMIRSNDGVIWALHDTPKEAKKFIPEVAEEITAIYKDVCDLKKMDCLYHEANEARKTARKQMRNTEDGRGKEKGGRA